MTKVLVAYASKMGGTAGIAEAIAAELRSCGAAVDLSDAQDVPDVAGYDAVLVGSAIYAWRWRRSAVTLLRRVRRAREVPKVWLFHSGPTGPDAGTKSVPAPKKVAALADELGAAPPETFGGRIEAATAKGLIARSMAKGDLAGDFRDLDRARDWARRIAASLAESGAR